VPPGTIEVLTDAGIDYAVLRRSDLSPDLVPEAKPAFEIAATGEIVVPTGKVTVRWDTNASVLDEFLDSGEAVLERDYGKGGIIAPTDAIDPIELARRLDGIKGVTRTEVQTLRKAVRR
jgi:hypothetical protein